ncbi:hypothetical protein BASA62_006312 [Batrachochytrium salamandrivorans]|nr:hypothetical protein BASA62_006312 [Batrachochytrium salamandrivorans]
MGRVIDSLAGKVCGAVTDNTTTNRSAWSMLKKKYPNPFLQSYASHGSHLWKLKLQKAQLTKNLPSLVQPASTRWGFLEGVFQKLEKKVDTFCTASFLPRTLLKGQASRKRVGKKSMTSLRTLSKKTKVEDLILDYGSETEQAQQMGKKEEMYLQYTNFVIKANHNKDRKDFLLSDVGKGNQDNPAVLVG